MSTLPDKILDQTVGALFIGFGLSFGLFGVLTIQVYIYYRLFPHDGLYLRILVPTLWIFELFDQVIISHSAYYYVIRLWGDAFAIIAGPPLWSLLLIQTCGTIVGTVVKIIFVSRIWRFSGRNRFVTGGISILIALQFATGIVFTKAAFDQPTLLVGIQNLKAMTIPALVAGCVADVLTAVALTYYLLKMRTGTSRADTLLSKLIVYGLSTGALSGALGLATLIIYQVMPNTFGFMTSFIAMSKVLAISLLTSLNTRQSARMPTVPNVIRPEDLGLTQTQSVSIGNETLQTTVDHHPVTKMEETLYLPALRPNRADFTQQEV